MMETVTSLINSYFHEPHASLVNGILLGRKLFVPQSFYDNLKTVGLIHIVVLSGQNISMISALILTAVTPTIGRRWGFVVSIAGIMLFVWFVGFDPPVVRAAIMGVLGLVGLLMGRISIPLYSLFLASVIMLLFEPSWAGSISFQLSFGATLGIILFGSTPPETEKKSVRTGIMYRFQKYLYDEFRISFAAQVFTLPIIFWYFRQISFVSPLANILISWLIAPIMILGLATVLSGLVVRELGFFISWTLYAPLYLLVKTVETLARIPFAQITW